MAGNFPKLMKLVNTKHWHLNISYSNYRKSKTRENLKKPKGKTNKPFDLCMKEAKNYTGLLFRNRESGKIVNSILKYWKRQKIPT